MDASRQGEGLLPIRRSARSIALKISASARGSSFVVPDPVNAASAWRCRAAKSESSSASRPATTCASRTRNPPSTMAGGHLLLGHVAAKQARYLLDHGRAHAAPWYNARMNTVFLRSAAAWMPMAATDSLR